MTFKGWVALRRGILEHTMLGKLTNNEALGLITLITTADHRTGSGTINAPTLRTFLPELSYDAAKRVLHSLEEKKYIFRAVVPFSKVVYRYWVNHYELSEGPHKLLQINLEHVFESKNIKDIQYVKPAPDGALDPALDPALDGALHPALDPAPNNNNDQNKKKNTNKPSLIEKEVCASMSDNEYSPEAVIVSTECGTLVPGGEHMVSIRGSHGDSDGDSHGERKDALPPNKRMRWSGEAGTWVDITSERPVPIDVANQRLSSVGLKHREGKMFDLATSEPVEWSEGMLRITGIASGRKAA